MSSGCPILDDWFKRRSAAVVLALSVFSLNVGCGTDRSKTTSSPVNSPSPAVASQPVLGYAWDPVYGGLRSMFGIPGAAYLDNNLSNTKAFSSASLCMRKSYALLGSSSGAIYVASLPGGQPTLITPQIFNNQQILVSPSCSKALVFALGTSAGVLISGLPSSPVMRPLTFAIAGSLVGAAVGDLGDVLLAIHRQDGSTGVQFLSSAGVLSNPLQLLQGYGAMTFAPESETVLIADAGANSLTMISLPSSNPSFIPLASASDGVFQPFAVASSIDGRAAFIANNGEIPLISVSLSGPPTPIAIPCVCKPTELVPLSGNAVFQVSDLASGSIYILDGTGTMPKMLFIPASRNVILAGAGR
jgi:hypothetical protein